MATIALCMIAKNEELLIKNAIESVKPIVDEIIVVDTGSTDKTKEIAETCEAAVYDYVWQNDFAKAKNFAKEKATADWILFLDADECMSKQDIFDIKKVVDRESKNSNTAEENETGGKKEVVAFAFISRHWTGKEAQEKYVQWKALGKKEKEALISEFPLFAPFDGYYDVAFITRLFKNNPKISFAGEVHEDVTPSINAWDQTKQRKLIVQCPMPIHHLHFLKGEDYVEQKQKRYFELSKEKFKQVPDAKIAVDLAVGYLFFEKDSAQSFHYLKEAIRMQPTSNMQRANTQRQRLDVVEALLVKKHDLRALHELMAMLDLSQHDFNSVLNLAKAYFSIKAYRAAIVVLKRLFLAAQRDPVIIEYLGVCYDHIKYYDDAIKVFEHGIVVLPTNATFYFNLGALYEKVKAWDKAIAAFQYAINNEHPVKAQLPGRIKMLRNIAQGKHVQYNINIGDV